MEGEKKMKTREEEVQVEIGLLHRRATNAQRTHEKMLGITSHQENPNQNHSGVHHLHPWMAVV